MTDSPREEEPAAREDAPPAKSVWQVSTHWGVVEVRADGVDITDTGALFTVASGEHHRAQDVVAVVPWTSIAYAGDNRYLTVVEPPVRMGEVSGGGADAG